MKDKNSLSWYYYVMFSVVTLVALSMTWWSMYDLGVHILSIPVLIAAGVSLIFDIGGMYLGLLSIQYAKTNDSGFWTELGAFVFIGTSTYIVVQHAVLGGYPHAGIVLFAAAPIVLGIMLKATLHYLTRLQRREAGRITERLPSVGWLTWLRYGPQAWKLVSVAMQGRLINAADKLSIAEDKHNIFGQTEVVSVPSVLSPEIVQDRTDKLSRTNSRTDINSQDKLSEPVVLKQLTSADKVSLPLWLPHEPDIKLSTLVRTCLDNSVSDIETIYRYARTLKGDNVSKMSLSRTLTREKQKAI